MLWIRVFTILVGITVSCVAGAGEDPVGNAKGLPAPANPDGLQLLQGTWEGVQVSDQARQKITITITGNSLHFHRDTNFWFETTIALPVGREPRQLHATIRKCPDSQASSIGQVVKAVFTIEDGKLTLATIPDDAEEAADVWEDTKNQGNRYELRKVQPRKKPAPTSPAR